MGRFKYSYNSLVYYGERVEDSIQRLVKYGYDAIELVGEPQDYDPDLVRRTCQDSGLSVSGICSIYTGDERDLTHPDASMRGKAMDYVRSVVDFAADVGAETIIARPSPVGRVHVLSSKEQEWEWAVENIRAAGEYAKSANVDLTVEPWNRYETHFINRLDEAVDLWRATGLDNGGVHGDMFHMNIEEDSIAAAYRRAGSLVNYVHGADSTRAAPGTGHIDFREVLAALDEIDYQGYVSFELLPASADPFGVMKAGGHHDFFDKYTEQSIRVAKEVESKLFGDQR